MRWSVTWLTSLWVTLIPALTSADPPARLPYQGVLLAPDGSPRNGPVNLTVGIFDDQTAGTKLYEESFTGVSLVDGLFSVELGSGQPAAGLPPFSPALFAGGGTRWLALSVNGEPLSPRQQFLSVPYALESATVGGQTPAQIRADGAPVAGYQRVSVFSSGSATAIAPCPVGKLLLGGGCDCQDAELGSAPVPGSNFWRCECSSAGDGNRAYVLCADAVSGTCGDGILGTGEQCDSNEVSACGNGRCSDTCTCSCGNGALDPGEQCDGANAAACLGLPCLASCQCAPQVKLPDGAPNCSADADCLSDLCLTGYADGDNDGFGSGAAATFCTVLPMSPVRYVASSGDCCDSNVDVRPNQTAFFSTPIPGACSQLGFNYNCSTIAGTPSIQHEYPLNGCNGFSCTQGSESYCSGTSVFECGGASTGWSSPTTYPGCGTIGTLRSCSTFPITCGSGAILCACGALSTSSQIDRCH